MAKHVLVVVWMVALALVVLGNAGYGHLLVEPLIIFTSAAAIGLFALGMGGIVYYGAGIVRLHRQLRQPRMGQRPCR